jgi:hypothetical protein
MYFIGKGAPQDDAEAVRWFRKAAEQGDGEAQFSLNLMHANGKGTQADDVAAAHQDDVEAQVAIGEMFETSDDARADDVAAVSQDDAEAIDRDHKPAERNDAGAQVAKGEAYDTGRAAPGDFDNGVAAYQDGDYATALREWKPLAQLGHIEAQNNLGAMHFNGEGVLQDMVTAHMWLNIAGANGNNDARKNRDTIAKQMTLNQLAEAQLRAKRCMNSNYRDCD